MALLAQRQISSSFLILLVIELNLIKGDNMFTQGDYQFAWRLEKAAKEFKQAILSGDRPAEIRSYGEVLHALNERIPRK